MGWKYRIGLILIGTVVLIWVTSAEVTQSIFTAYRHPFVLTWLGASLLIVYLPISLLNDQIKSCIVKARKSPGTFSALTPSDSPMKSPLKNGRKGSDLELQHLMLRKDSDLDLEPEEESASFSRVDSAHPAKNHGKLLSWDLVKASFMLAPLWFLTEYLSNGALALTSVASTTILSSTAGLFTLVFGTILGQDSFNISKAVAVIMTITGVAMTTLGKTWSTDEAENAIDDSSDQHSLWGDALGLCSAVSYGLFTILLKKSAGEGGSHVDMQRIFGYIGLFTLFGLWWLIWPLSWLGLEPVFSLPTTIKVDEVLLANGILGSVVSDYFWALSVVWTTPLVATLGMSLTIPLAMVADMVVHGRHYSGIYVLGSLQVFAGFVVANLTDQCTRKIGL
ncbi:solute carrier family 35, member F5 [Marchantia polymorpha subsp. ruderalis]|uniref:EamA domain-containing protein n=2 Tax=Marchantia polymorpha TaxID=3197 RepID=A0A176W534_MARPO|nr:hypothetical protein AXG93_3337s1040 [Marchantia polymorpha subsp. ruderalis]PTQ43295.1 hypothetical protein MARPO_0025s0005 [Marchantia polymorpha]BBN03838.1 hypothetical protein Mp_2g26800 [Marchantia polymorpha subsp. ruderalis]|eukprot:PTQ43295.1 hypothetical protein MARPO_0025s0005 [Marchantia polymorpha]